jgi:hypothetical protein
LFIYNDERQPLVSAVRGRIARRARAARAFNIRGAAVAGGAVARGASPAVGQGAAVRVYENRRNQFQNGRGGGAVGGAIAIVSIVNAFKMS